MELTEGQKKGLEIACERYKKHESYTVICGYAGTGKSTLVQFIISALKISPDDVAYIAYTGRAALILRNKGCGTAMTAHRLLYKSEEQPDGTFTHTPKKHLDHNYKIIVCDEASMLPQEMIDLLLSHNIYTLFLGDNEQLPPIDGEQTILDSPHVFLSEVTRQALDNPIIKLSMDVRNGISFSYGGDKKCRVIPESKVSNGLLLGADEIIVGKNVTRHKLNDHVRRIKWGDKYSIDPIEGEKVICLKNNWDKLESTGDVLVNGQVGIFHNVSITEVHPYGKVIFADFISDEGDSFNHLMIDYKLMVDGKPTINSNNWREFYNYPILFEFAYGYVITCHKSQGGEFNRVIVYDEAFGDTEQRKRWRYTAVTRASKQLVIIK